MVNSLTIGKMPYGGDYNPEQWDGATRQEDMRLLKLAHVDIVTLNVFNWSALQKDDEEYDFRELDKIMDMVKENRLKVCLATSTAAHPAWMARKYPENLIYSERQTKQQN
ncbi:MAG: Beta-galactosidase [Herbinix sp.]|jgi:beta-galactosidase|nr:Beta-galactosidase [Herbinix sp.]